MKKLLALIVASMASSLFLYALVSQDQPAKHPDLRATDLPPLIAVRDFYAGPDGNQDKRTFSSGTLWQHWNAPVSEITARLTVPQTKNDPGPLPAVVLINSEPRGGTGPDSDRTVRFLANRGYVVLSIDCGDYANTNHTVLITAPQGSGRCTENTIVDEARSLIDQGIADPAALAIIGSGVGGYLALITMSLDPDLFKAAIVHAAVTDQAGQFPENQITLMPQQAAVKTGLHPAGTDRYTKSLTAKSPIDLVGNIQGAVLMTHGKADTVAGVEQAQSYAKELLDFRKDAEIVYFNHEDHCYSRWQTRVQVARLTENFLARHLGGRNGGYDYIELLAKLF